MKYIKPYSQTAFLNSFVNFITSEFENKIFIQAVDFTNFIVVKGVSLDDELIDLTEIKNKFKEKKPEYFVDRMNFNIIDLIDYTKKIKLNQSNFSFDYYNCERPIYHSKILTFMSNFNINSQFETIDYDDKLIIQCDENTKTDYSPFGKFDFPTLNYQSTFPNGLSNKSIWKILFFYGEYIAFNLFKILLTDKITLEFQVNDYTDEEYYNFDKINATVKVDCQYNSNDVTSLVRDIFDFNLTKFKELYLSNYDFQNEIEFPFGEKPWLVHDKGKDLLIF